VERGVKDLSKESKKRTKYQTRRNWIPKNNLAARSLEKLKEIQSKMKTYKSKQKDWKWLQ